MYSLLKKLQSKKFAAILMLGWTLIFSTPAAYAHAKLLRSQPAEGEIVYEKPEVIELTFNERLQTTNVNSIVVTDRNGKRVDKNSVIVSEDGKKVWCELEELSSGIYAVEWKTLSADNHSIKGNFVFTVAGDNTSSAAPPSQALNDNQTIFEHQMPMQESKTTQFQSIVRWLIYLAMMLLFGGFGFLLLVLKPSFQQTSDLSSEERNFGFRRGEERFIQLSWLSLFLLAASTFAGLVLQTSAVLDVSIAQAFAPSRLYQVLTQTNYGLPWLLQVFIMLALFIVIFFITFRRNKLEKINLKVNTPLLWIAFLVSSLLFLTPSLTGHAQAAAGEFRFAVFSDWLHLVAGGVWVGGLFHLALTLPKSIENLQSWQRMLVLSRAIPLFSRIAVACTVLLVLTGVYNSWIHISNFSAMWKTLYGVVLLVKIVLFLIMLALGGLNTFVLRPRVERLAAETISAEEQSKILGEFYWSLRVEVILGIAVLLLAAILAFLPPARKHFLLPSGGKVSNSLRNN
jgi:copper transport protein